MIADFLSRVVLGFTRYLIERDWMRKVAIRGVEQNPRYWGSVNRELDAALGRVSDDAVRLDPNR